MRTGKEELENAKEQVRMRADIVSVIGRYVNLKAHGSVMKGLCPFHNEKTPSFNVNPARGFFHCFGCGKGGDVFRFLQDIEGIGFREALEMLAEETGVKLPERRERGGGYDGRYDDQYGETPPSKTDLFAIHDEAAKFYYGHVKSNPPAIEYFKARGLNAATVKEFSLGYAPAGWSSLCDHLKNLKFSRRTLADSGLFATKDGYADSMYDRFRDRVMFPLCDLSGRVVAFAGRGLNSDTQPKYLNSPETPLYRKSGILYGLHKARQNVRESGQLLIVEGYMDYLTLWQAGIRNAAAVSGTAFTEEHAHLIKRFASKVTLVFDGDRAGLSAARRTAFVLAPVNMQVSILALPNNHDPDSFVKRNGAEAFTQLLSSPQTRPAADFLIDGLASEFDDGSPHGKSRVINELAPYARALADPVVRDAFLSALSRRLRIDRKLVENKITSVAAPRDYRLTADAPQDAEDAAPAADKMLGKLEESFLLILLSDPELIVQAQQYISPEFFTDNTLSANIYSIILDVYAQNGSLDALPDAVRARNDRALERAVAMLTVKSAQREDIPEELALKLRENIQDELVQKILLLRKKFLKAQMALLREELDRCPDSEKGRFLEEIRKCGESLKELG